MKIFVVFFTALFIENIVFTKFYGAELFDRLNKKPKELFLGSALFVAVMTLTGAVNGFLYSSVLAPRSLDYLMLVTAVITSSCIFILLRFVLEKFLPTIYNRISEILPVTCLNSAIVAISLLRSENFATTATDFGSTVLYSFASAMGLVFALFVFRGVKKRIEVANPPDAFRGYPILLLSLGLVALAFSGFLGVIIGK